MIQGKIYVKEQTVRSGKNLKQVSFFIIDAKPRLMGRLRALFPVKGHTSKGDFTHKVISILVKSDVCRDIEWILERYSLEVSPEAQKLIREGSDAHRRMAMAIGEMQDFDNVKARNWEGVKGFTPIQNAEVRSYQTMLLEYVEKVNSKFILGDEMGLGKTVEVAILLQLANWRPAIICVPLSITDQWVRRLKQFQPTLKVFVTPIGNTREIPEDTDIVITNYSRIAKWEETLIAFKPKAVIFDEGQELRKSGSPNILNL